jgi:hypothetical protein
MQNLFSWHFVIEYLLRANNFAQQLMLIIYKPCKSVREIPSGSKGLLGLAVSKKAGAKMFRSRILCYITTIPVNSQL